jgi:putative membrane protein
MHLVFDWEWMLALVVVAVDYAYVVHSLAGRGEPTPWYRKASFAAGLVLIAVALFSPIEHYALTSMVSFHLLQNVMIADWAPPLLILGLTPAMMHLAERRRWVRALTNPVFALVFWLVAWYVLHVPAVYDYALRNHWALGVEHLVFITAGLLFWWPVISPGRMQPGHRLGYLVIAFVAASPLALGLALTGSPVYDFYRHTHRLWGLSALEDQQIGAITMAVEQAAILFVACGISLAALLEQEGAND